MNQRRDFEWLAQSAADFLTRPADWPETRYEAKARRKGHEVWYFDIGGRERRTKWQEISKVAFAVS